MISALAPHLCRSCGVEGALLCANCKNNIGLGFRGDCALCGADIGVGCDGHAPLGRVVYAGQRSGALQWLIGAFKFRYTWAAGPVLASIVAPCVPDDAVLVPLPSHASRTKVRGYDPVLVLALAVGRLRGLQVLPCLTKLTTTIQHDVKTRQDRLAAAKGAYYCRDRLDATTHYVLIDDICTTGGTLMAAADALYQAGAVHITAVVVAKQPLD